MTTYLERYAALATKLISSSGGEALHNLSPELMLTVELEGDRPEFALLGNTRLWVARSGLLAAGGAGTFNQVLMSSNSPGLLTVVTHVFTLQAVNVGIVAGSGFTGPVATAVKHRDARARSVPGTQLFTKNTGAALLGGAVGSMLIPASVLLEIPAFVQVTGSPFAQGTIMFENQTSNAALEMWLAGYERPADPHEFDATVS